MSINFANLAAQGRAKSTQQAWSPEEWEAVCTLVTKRNMARSSAADYVRNGILTVEAYDKAQEKDFKPMSQEEAAQKAEEDLKARGAEITQEAAAEAPTSEALEASSEEKPKKTRSKSKNND